MNRPGCGCADCWVIYAEDLEDERDALREENERLRRTLALAEPDLQTRADFYRRAERPE